MYCLSIELFFFFFYNNYLVKDNLSVGEIIMLLDFAENYSFICQDALKDIIGKHLNQRYTQWLCIIDPKHPVRLNALALALLVMIEIIMLQQYTNLLRLLLASRRKMFWSNMYTNSAMELRVNIKTIKIFVIWSSMQLTIKLLLLGFFLLRVMTKAHVMALVVQ